MSQQPYVAIPLRDGAQASVSADAVRVGERVFALDDIQDARQVAPDPETVALRVANERHVVELQPAHPGDGSLLLEALFRLRPSLRPAGFDAPAALPAGFPPLPMAPEQSPAGQTWPANSTWPPHPAISSPPPGVYPPLPPVSYAPPGLSGGRLSPYPRSISDLVGATFELFMAHWKSWLLLGIVALFVPEILRGGVDAVFHILGGHDLWAGLPLATNSAANGTFGVGNTSLLSTNDLMLATLNAVVDAAVGALVGGWSAAVLGIASRDALFGRAPQVRADLRAGAKRVLSALGASLLSGILTFVVLVPLAILYLVLLTQYGAVISDPTTLDPSSPAATAAALLACLTLVLLLPSAIAAVYVGIRLAISPYIAATEPLGPVAAVRKSWSLTRGQWWHTFTPIFLVALIVAVISIPAEFLQYASFGVANLVVIPLVAALTAPLGKLVAVAVLYDLRLRREGYAALAGEGRPADVPVPTSP